MTFASNFVAGRDNVAYAIECADSAGTAVEATADGKCPTGSSEKSTADVLSASEKEEIAKIVTKFVLLEQWLNKLIWPVFMMIGGLINNEMIFSNGMDTRLYDIWVQIRNLVNIVFVIVLVGIALYSVLGISSESSQYSIKTMLPKLVVGIIAVNFSFLAVKVIIDATTVVTTAIFAIPDQTSGVLGNTKIIDGKDTVKVSQLCKKLYSAETTDELNKSIETIGIETFDNNKHLSSELTKGQTLKQLIDGDEKLKKEYEDFSFEFKGTAICMVDAKKNMVLTQNGINFLSKFRSNNAALAMAINMGGILFSDEQSRTGVTSATTVTQLAINIIFSFALNFVYLFAFFTLFLVLIARLVVVWISLAFSPVLALGLTVPGISDKVELFKTLQEKFIKHITAPIVIAITMTIGWIMLGAMNGMVTSSSPSMPGSILDKAIPGIPLPGLETIQSLIVAICTAAVVWLGAKSAADGTYVSGAVNLVGEQLTRLGKFVAKAPFLYTPIVPVQITGEDGKRNATLAEAGLGFVNKINDMENKTREGGRTFGEEIFNVSKGSRGLSDLTSSSGFEDAMTVIGGRQISDKKALAEKIRESNSNSPWVRTLKSKADDGDPEAKKAYDLVNKILSDDKFVPTDNGAKILQNFAKKQAPAKTEESESKSNKKKPDETKKPVVGKQAGETAPAPAPVKLTTALVAAAGLKGEEVADPNDPKRTALVAATTAVVGIKDDTAQGDIEAKATKIVAAIKDKGFDDNQKKAIVEDLKLKVPPKHKDAFAAAVKTALEKEGEATKTAEAN